MSITTLRLNLCIFNPGEFKYLNMAVTSPRCHKTPIIIQKFKEFWAIFTLVGCRQ